MTALSFQVLDSLEQVAAEQWNALHASDYPFIQHEFLVALERHGCVSERYGWLPKHLLFWQGEQLVGAIPLYEKHNNYGEFVFDHSWAQAWESIGLAYYPKLVSAAPYTPAKGPRVLLSSELSGVDRPVVLSKMLEMLKAYTVSQGYSGCHLLFSNEQVELAKDNEILCRHDVQFQWFNQQYEAFDDFLAHLKPKKRKNIRQERRAVFDAGITFEVLDGDSASRQDWEEFAYFYQKTFLEKWSTPTLNLNFFLEIAQTLPKSIVLVLAKREGVTIAGALMFRSNSVLYGRHWGCGEQVKHLHFETCFYQGIDYAITHGISRFEPGAGGEHKIARGFVPVPMQSAHWLAANPFVQGIERFLQEEKLMIEAYVNEVWHSVPYQSTEALKRHIDNPS